MSTAKNVESTVATIIQRREQRLPIRSCHPYCLHTIEAMESKPITKPPRNLEASFEEYQANRACTTTFLPKGRHRRMLSSGRNYFLLIDGFEMIVTIFQCDVPSLLPLLEFLASLQTMMHLGFLETTTPPGPTNTMSCSLPHMRFG